MKEIPFKVWKSDEAQRLGIKEHALEMRLSRGTHPYPKNLVRKNSRAIKVVQEPATKHPELFKAK